MSYWDCTHFQISINNIVLMQVAQGWDYLRSIEPGPILRKSLPHFLNLSIEVEIEIPADGKLHHKAEPIRRLKRIFQLLRVSKKLLPSHL